MISVCPVVPISRISPPPIPSPRPGGSAAAGGGGGPVRLHRKTGDPPGPGARGAAGLLALPGEDRVGRQTGGGLREAPELRTGGSAELSSGQVGPRNSELRTGGSAELRAPDRWVRRTRSSGQVGPRNSEPRTGGSAELRAPDGWVRGTQSSGLVDQRNSELRTTNKTLNLGGCWDQKQVLFT